MLKWLKSFFPKKVTDEDRKAYMAELKARGYVQACPWDFSDSNGWICNECGLLTPARYNKNDVVCGREKIN